MTLRTTQFPIHPIPTTGTAGVLNAIYFLRCDCEGERTDPTPMEAAIKPFTWLARVLSGFFSTQGLLSICTDSSWRAKRRKLLESSPRYLEERLSHLQSAFSPRRDVHGQKHLRNWYSFFQRSQLFANAARSVSTSYLPWGKILQLAVNPVQKRQIFPSKSCGK